MPSIHKLHGMGHCILRKGRQGECGAVESKSIQIVMQCHSATADNTSDSDDKVATRGEKILYIKPLISSENLILPLLDLYTHILDTFLSPDKTLNSSWSIRPQMVSSSYIGFRTLICPSST